MIFNNRIDASFVGNEILLSSQSYRLFQLGYGHFKYAKAALCLEEKL